MQDTNTTRDRNSEAHLKTLLNMKLGQHQYVKRTFHVCVKGRQRSQTSKVLCIQIQPHLTPSHVQTKTSSMLLGLQRPINILRMQKHFLHHLPGALMRSVVPSPCMHTNMLLSQPHYKILLNQVIYLRDIYFTKG